MAKPASLTLPLIEPAESARDALKLMRKFKRSGVLTLRGGHWWLYDAARIVIALSENPGASLGEVRATKLDAAVSPMGHVASIAMNRPQASSRRRGLAVRGTMGAARRLTATMLETLAAGPYDCYCVKDKKPVPGGRTGGDCPYGHRQSVNCVSSR